MRVAAELHMDGNDPTGLSHRDERDARIASRRELLLELE